MNTLLDRLFGNTTRNPARELAHDISLLRLLIAYEPETGALTWLPRGADLFEPGNTSRAGRAKSWNAKWAGKPALNCVSSGGYLHGALFGLSMKAHRAAWAIVHGEWPTQVDHINSNRQDNRLCNLRNVTHQENSRNQMQYSTNTTGATGVIYCPRNKNWQARISVGSGRRLHLGTYSTFEEAVAVRAAAEKQHGYHRNHGLSVARQMRDELGLEPDPRLK